MRYGVLTYLAYIGMFGVTLVVGLYHFIGW